MRGKQLYGLVHVADWYATLSEAAGMGPHVPAAGPAAADGMSVWPYITGQVSHSPRTEMVLDHRMFSSESAGVCARGQSHWTWGNFTTLGALRRGRYKLIVGPEGFASWYGEFSPNASATAPNFHATGCTERPCLFDIATDPGEHHDLSVSRPHLLNEMLAAFKSFETAYHPPARPPPRNGDAFCAAVRRHDGWVAPWLP